MNFPPIHQASRRLTESDAHGRGSTYLFDVPMTSPLSPISSPAVSPVNPARALPDLDGTRSAPSEGGEQGAAGFAGAIGRAVSNGLDTVGSLEQTVTAASQQAAVGDLESVTDFMIATTEAQLATEITVAVRDRAVTAFNDIMRMQI